MTSVFKACYCTHKKIVDEKKKKNYEFYNCQTKPQHTCDGSSAICDQYVTIMFSHKLPTIPCTDISSRYIVRLHKHRK